jgi:hypothetical protein
MFLAACSLDQPKAKGLFKAVKYSICSSFVVVPDNKVVLAVV